MYSNFFILKHILRHAHNGRFEGKIKIKGVIV